MSLFPDSASASGPAPDAPSDPDRKQIHQDIQRVHELTPEPSEEDIRKARELGPDAPGTGANSPLSMPKAGWKIVLRQVFSEVGSSQTSLSAAGCAFYATLSLFPAISSLISLYGLAFDLQTVEPQLEVLRHLLPP
ncbi:MAG: trehalose-binding protein, partial [Gluconobacter sp.]